MLCDQNQEKRSVANDCKRGKKAEKHLFARMWFRHVVQRFLVLLLLVHIHHTKPRVSKLRPAKPFHPAREAVLSMMKTTYIYEKFVDW